MAKRKSQPNYLDFIPVRNPENEYTTDEAGVVTISKEWKGFYHTIAQKFFHKPRVSQIKLDSYGSFVWSLIDGERDVHAMAQELDRAYPDMEKSLSRLIRFLEILHDHRFILWKGEETR